MSFTQGKDLFSLIKTLKARHPDLRRDDEVSCHFVIKESALTYDIDRF